MNVSNIKITNLEESAIMRIPLMSLLLCASINYAATSKISIQKLSVWNGETTKGMQVYAIGDSILYTTGLTKGLGIIDIKAPSAPSLLSSLRFGPTVNSSYATPFLNDMVVVCNADHGYSYVVDVKDKKAPRILDTIKTTEGPGSVELTVKDSIIYASTYNAYKGGLGIYRWNKNSKIEKLSFLQLDGKVWSAAIKDTILAVSEGSSGVAIISVSNPSAPKLLAKAAVVNGEAFSTTWHDNQIWTIDTYGNLSGYDLSQPSKPKSLAKIKLSTSPGRRISSHRDFLFVTTQYELFIVDVQSPEKPTVIENIDGNNYSGTIASDSLLYVMTESSGMSIYKWKAMYPPRLIAPTGSVRKGKVNFIWTAPEAAKSYQFYLSKDSTFAKSEFNLPLNDTTFTTPSEIQNGNWWWKVMSLPDSITSLPKKLEVYSDNAPFLKTFEGNSIPGPIKLHWLSSLDSTSDYKIEISNSLSFISPISFLSKDTSAEVPVALSPGKWYWRVISGNYSSQIDSFVALKTVSITAKQSNQTFRINSTNNTLSFYSFEPARIIDIHGRIIYTSGTKKGLIEIPTNRFGIKKFTPYIIQNRSFTQVFTVQ